MRVTILLTLFSLALTHQQQEGDIGGHASRPCRRGRELRVLATGEEVCVCASKCPSRQRLVCGSDGLLYLNHCELHKAACLKKKHITPLRGDRSCEKDPLILLKSLIDKAATEVRIYEEQHVQVPETCRQNERNRLREFFMSWMSISADNYDWHHEDMSYTDLVMNHYKEADTDTNGLLDSDEWLSHFKSSKTSKALQDSKLQEDRRRCLEALIDEGDANGDRRLSLSEFQEIMNHSYEPSIKDCIMDGHHYEDGAKTKVDCNGCICSCGNWVCTSNPCQEIPYKVRASPKQTGKTTINSEEEDTEEVFTYDDMDNVVQ